MKYLILVVVLFTSCRTTNIKTEPVEKIGETCDTISPYEIPKNPIKYYDNTKCMDHVWIVTSYGIFLVGFIPCSKL